MPGWGVRLKEFWTADGNSLRPGASPEALQAFENRFGVPLPPDFREYLLAVDGTAECEMPGTQMVSFWSLDRITPIGDPEEGLFEFADFLLHSHTYVIRLKGNAPDWGHVYIKWNTAADSISKAIATSYEEFVTHYLDDSVRLAGG